ncbi:AI-2E family transporter [Pontibacter harenae]|uniref:AI-2E family transporter n=1 Tax=Pontibacter harenae TaxID=2894083 RepID=UPI001E49CB12|nr:AI-2E family transporter [Pontibacter harenae]MCC9166345.1 AI-2E family transporter [Pontibacter harenae]
MDIYTFSKRVALAAFLVLLIGAGFYLLGNNLYFFLLVFAGILLSVLFCGMTDWITNKMHIKRGISLTLSVLFFFGILVGAFILLAPTVNEQVQEMKQTIPQSLNQVEEWLSDREWGEKVINQIPDDVSTAVPEGGDIASKVGGVFSSTISFLADLAIVIITALFFASSPKLYTEGFAKLFPKRKRYRVLEVLDKCYKTLKLWLVGMLSAMAVIGVSTAIGYSLIGLPMALALGFIAFLLAFVPNIGPWLAGIPAVLVGLTEGSQVALYVILVYGGIQLIESYVITPIIFQKTVDLPPALLLFVQVLFGILQGGLGLLMAAPLLAVVMVLVNELYIKDVLEKPTDQEAAAATSRG